MPSTVTHIPAERVPEVVATFMREGKVVITCTRTADGTWTITAQP